MILAMRNIVIQHKATQLISSIAFAAMFVVGSSDVVAQKAVAEPLQIKLVRAKILLENGKEITQNASTAKPGDILEEVATYTNTSRAILKSVEATLPVPQNTELVMASIKPANAKASVDGKNFSPIPLVRKIRQPNGVEVEQIVPLSEYRYLRWYPGELAPDKPMSFSARFAVANNPVVSNNSGK
jgi:hypothetical protein